VSVILSELTAALAAMTPGDWDRGWDPEDGEVSDVGIGKVVARVRRHPVAANVTGIAALKNAAPDRDALLDALAKVHP
jgi:hypothetical protein